MAAVADEISYDAYKAKRLEVKKKAAARQAKEKAKTITPQHSKKERDSENATITVLNKKNPGHKAKWDAENPLPALSHMELDTCECCGEDFAHKESM